MKTFFVVAFAIMVCSARAQNAGTSTVAWNSGRTVDVGTGKISMEETRLVVYKQDSVIWKIHDETRGRFVIKHTNGGWTNIAAPGEIGYNVEGNGKRGIIRIKKTVGGTTIRLIVVNKEGSVTTDLSITDNTLLQ